MSSKGIRSTDASWPETQKMCRYSHLHAPSGCFVNIYAKEACFCFKSELLRSSHVGLLVNNRDQRRKQPGHAVTILLSPCLPLLQCSAKVGSCCDNTIATLSTPATVLGKGWFMLWPILLPPRLPLLMTSLIRIARHTQPGSTHSAKSSVFITFICGFVTNRTKDWREKMLRIYCLYHSSVNLLFTSLLCESTVYSTLLWVYCLFYSSVSLLFILLLCESTVYSTLLWVYCLCHYPLWLVWVSTPL